MTIPTRMTVIVGSEYVRNDPASLGDYAVDGCVPVEVAMPASAEEVAEIVRQASSENRAVIATGARTKTGIGNVPRAYHYAVDISRMKRVVAYDPGDLTLSVEPGVTLATLAELLAEHNQFLPLAVPFREKATIGGTIASGVDSPLRHFYGTARDFLLGAEFVTGDGVLAKSGGCVVKNVTGYDMHKLMIGSLGTLGIITRLNFKTFPLPAGMRDFRAQFASLDGALSFRSRIASSPLAPLSLEVMNSEAAKLMLGSEEIAPDRGRWTVACRFAGSPEVSSRYETELKGRVAACEGSVGIASKVNGNQPSACETRYDFVDAALKAFPFATIVKAGVLPTQMGAVIRAAEAAAAKNGLRLATNARSVGIIYCAFLAKDIGDEAQSAVLRACVESQSACDALGGHATILWCPAEWKSELQLWGPARPDATEMKKLKTAFDPKGILSPGRFVGGI
jgi:glycolate oxidase FAD binding subunit